MVAIIEKCVSQIDYSKYFDFDFEVYGLSSVKVDKLKKADIDLDFEDIVEKNDFVILVGAEALKFVAKATGIVQYQGYLLEEKFIPLTSPMLAKIKPESRPAFEKAVADIHEIVNGTANDNAIVDVEGITTEERAEEYLQYVIDNHSVLAIDTETSALYPRDGYVLGVSMSHKTKQGVYIDSSCINEKCEDMLRHIFETKTCVFHNSKFDIKFMDYHFRIGIPNKLEDTMLMHYLLDENSGHGLKELAIKFTDLGDYDRELDTFKKQYCKDNKIKQSEFTYDLIPFDIIYKYAAIDTAATLELYYQFREVIDKSENLTRVYYELMIPGTKFLNDVEENGVPFSKDRLAWAKEELNKRIDENTKALYEFEEVKKWEANKGSIFNVNSPIQLRGILFESDYFGLTPIPGKVTGTGAISTDAEVLSELAKQGSKFCTVIDNLKKAKKLKATYVDKILLGLDADSRLRTGFNLHTTTSGRLSSSGKLNMQQLPRDDKIIKKCIVARPGYRIVSQDLQTAEMYIAAVLSGDKKLQSVFSSGGDFHSTIAHMVFNLPCDISEVKEKFGRDRQAAKAVSFGILYGSGPAKVAETVGCSLDEAKSHIKTYFNTFKQLADWLKRMQEEIRGYGYTFSAFGRKRRLPNVFSPDKRIAAGEVRSGVNALVQSVASDVNLYAAIDLQKWIKKNNLKTKIFGLVHDSILAEVADDEYDRYIKAIAYATQKDRGCSIPGYPIGVDVEEGEDYSFTEWKQP